MAEVIVPRSAVLGSREQIAADLKVGREYAGDVEHDARPLVRCYRRLLEAGAHEKWLKDEPRTWERFCREALGYEAAFLDAVDEGVRILEGEGHGGTISAELARAASNREQVRLAAQVTKAEDLLPSHREPEEVRKQNMRTSTQAARAAKNGVGHRTQQKLDRLAKGFPELLTRVRSGELTVSAADRLASGELEHISVPLEPREAADRLRRHFTPEQIAELVRLLEEHE